MNRLPHDLLGLLGLLGIHGPLPAGELTSRLGVSSASLKQAVEAAGGGIVARGGPGHTTYAARRALPGWTGPLPLYRIDTTGAPQQVARLDLTRPQGSAVEFLGDFGWPLDDRMREGWFDGLPYPLQDMRPQGFLGRLFARHHAAMLQVSDDLDEWADDDALHALSILGIDAPGDLLLGEAACQAWLHQVARARTDEAPVALGAGDVALAYPRLAETVMSMGVAGSSAGGEFPKFPSLRRVDSSGRQGAGGGGVQHVLVKFSGSDASPGTQRWSDLLVCEHLATQSLRDLGVRVSDSRVMRSGGRTFLEVDRFDRHGLLGRSGMVSWFALNAEFFGLSTGGWAEAGRRLLDQGWLAPADAQRLALLWQFGRLIGNTDMHDGNLSFVPGGPGSQHPLTLAPVYDMLPMLYAPARGVELPSREWRPALPLPAEEVAWAAAAGAAVTFWESVGADGRIGDDFRRMADDNAGRLRGLMA